MEKCPNVGLGTADPYSVTSAISTARHPKSLVEMAAGPPASKIKVPALTGFRLVKCAVLKSCARAGGPFKADRSLDTHKYCAAGAREAPEGGVRDIYHIKLPHLLKSPFTLRLATSH